MKKLIISILVMFIASVAQASLFIDFNSTTQDGGPHLDPAYQPYNAGHEVSADFVTQSYNTNFAQTGPATVSVTPAWPNTVDNRVQQMIDRPPVNDAYWLGSNPDLVTDFLGIDSRIPNGGNGDWDLSGSTTPTFMTLTLSGLPLGTYNWVSFHHDVEHVWSDFMVQVSTDGGAIYGAMTLMEMTDSTPFGNPANLNVYNGVPGGPDSLPSTFNTSMTMDGTNDLVLRFAPFVDGGALPGVHKQFFGINGFEVTQVPIPAAIYLLGAGFVGLVGIRRKIKK